MDWHVPTVSKAHAKQAAELIRRAHWTQQDVSEAMGWSVTKTRRVLRLYEKFGADCFADSPKSVRRKVLRGKDKAGPGEDLAFCARSPQATGRHTREELA